tara:strand:+ start:375 stop:641 length:267 start_codon:yes stop_codon:yes gene_type:complete
MKLLVSVKVTQGYQHWKNEFENEESINLRASAGIDVIGYGYSSEMQRVYVILSLESMEILKKVMSANQTLIDEAGVDMDSMQMIPLEG